MRAEAERGATGWPGRSPRRFGLSALDAAILLAALAPDVDRGFEPLYGYLNDDVGRRRATVALALELAGTGPYEPAARARFHPAAPLLSGGLLVVEDRDRPLPGGRCGYRSGWWPICWGTTAWIPNLAVQHVELLPPGSGTGGSGGGAGARGRSSGGCRARG